MGNIKEKVRFGLELKRLFTILFLLFTLTSLYGVLYSKDLSKIVCYPSGRQGKFTMPNNVTIIGNRAFDNCYNLTSVTISSNVTLIAEFAFSACTSLTQMSLPSSVNDVEFYAFYYCTNLKTVGVQGKTKEQADALLQTSGLLNISTIISETSESEFEWNYDTIIGYKGTDSIITPPMRCTNIEDFAFNSGCIGLS